MERASERGMAVVVASVEYEDLAHLCDRVIVVREGRQVAELRRDDLSADRIVERSYVAKYPGDTGAAVKAVCAELLSRLAAANAANPNPLAAPLQAAPPALG